MSETPPPPELKAPIQMWRDARALLVNLWSIVGNPEDLAQAIAVSRTLHKLYASWICVAEAVMRHLLMIEAAALPAPRAAPAQHARAATATTPAPRDFLPDQPNTWRVSFRTATADRRLLPGEASAKTGPAGSSARPARRALDPAARLAAGLPLHTRVLPTQPLALRYAAVLRVFNDPIPYARRLARRLHAEPQLARALVRQPPSYVHRIDRADDITRAAERAWPPPLPDSS